jgi:hypothetical protein
MASPEAAALPSARELTATALRRLLRGGSYQALAREIAWRAAHGRAPGASALQSLADLLEDELATRIAAVEPLVARAAASATAQHLERWPYDVPGAELAAHWAAEGEAAQAVNRLYADVLAWARELVPERPARRGLLPRLLGQR